MDAHSSVETIASIPEGFRAIPIHLSLDAPLRLCVLARPTPDPVLGHFILLRDMYDAHVYLGCVLDAEGHVQEWIELWVQNVEGLEATLPAYHETFSNALLDQRWTGEAKSLDHLNPENLLRTGWESTHPLPTYLDVAQGKPVYPGEEDPHGRWALCRDDALLAAAGLPPYSASLTRYWHQPGAGKESRFVPVVSGAPQTAGTQPLAAVLKAAEDLAPFNSQGGLLQTMAYYPLGFEDYVDLLGGKSWKGMEIGKKYFCFGQPYRQLEDWDQVQQNGACLFLGLHGRAGRFPEVFHLKLQLLLDVVKRVRDFTERQQLPLLNLSADSFRVKLDPLGTGLPFLWTARCGLVKPSHAFALPVESSDFRYFIRARSEGFSIYLPEGINDNLRGSGSVRIRKVRPPEHGQVVLEGTLVTPEKLAVSPHDLIWMRLPLPTGRVDLYGHLYAGESLAEGEIRFRTIPLKFPEPVRKALGDAEGISFARSPFEVVPLLSTPCDLYALGVLAVRTLLVDDQTTLAVSHDEVLSLARQVGAEHDPEIPLSARIRAIFEKDERFLRSLGPHRLIREEIEPQDAFRLLPAELWYDTLAVVVSLFAGMGPDSICRDYGDVPSLALETVFNQPLEALHKLLIRSRSLIVIDWNFNREINAVVRTLQDRYRLQDG